MKKIALIFICILLEVLVVYSQEIVKRDIVIQKTAPMLYLNGTGPLIKLNTDTVATKSYTRSQISQISLGAADLGVIVVTSADQTALRSSAWWTANKKYEIRDAIDLGGSTVTLPANVVLSFNGGKFSNGTFVGNNASFSVDGNRQIFEPSMSFSGSWSTTTVTPQNFGAIPSANNESVGVDASDAIQACVNSPFNIDIPPGNYYVADSIIITHNTTIHTYRGFNSPLLNAEITEDFDDPNRTVIYTDKSITIFVIKGAQRFYFEGGGTIDFTMSTTQKSTAFRYSLNNPDNRGFLQGGIDANIVGNRVGARTENGGSYGVVINEGTVDGTIGFMSYQNWKIVANFLNTGFWIKPYDYDGGSHYVNCCTLNMMAFGCKRGIFIEECHGYFTITGDGQTQEVLQESEKYYPMIEISGGSNQIDFFTYDLGSGVYGTYGYRNPYSVVDHSNGNYYSPKSMTQFTTMRIDAEAKPSSQLYIANPTELIINTKRYGVAGVTALTNKLAFADDRYGATINKYDGDGYNFATNLGPSTARSSEAGITIYNPENTFSLRGLHTGINFTTSGALQGGFVEIVIPTGENISNIGICLESASSRYIDSIQFISCGSSDTLSTFIMPSEAGLKIYEAPDSFNRTHTKLIIRLIGATSTGYVYINDIFGNDLTHSVSPIIDAGGGQTIFGTLSVSDNVRVGYTTRTTDGNTIELTEDDDYYQVFTGSTAQIIQMDTGYPTNWRVLIDNSSTAILTIQTDGGLEIMKLYPYTRAEIVRKGSSTAVSNFDTFHFSTLGSLMRLNLMATPPESSPSEGMIYADTDHHLYYYNGTSWIQLDN